MLELDLLLFGHGFEPRNDFRMIATTVSDGRAVAQFHIAVRGLDRILSYSPRVFGGRCLVELRRNS